MKAITYGLQRMHVFGIALRTDAMRQAILALHSAAFIVTIMLPRLQSLRAMT